MFNRDHHPIRLLAFYRATVPDQRFNVMSIHPFASDNSMLDAERSSLSSLPQAISILVGEDTLAAARALEKNLIGLGHVVIGTAHSHLDLINLGLRHRPDVILTSTRLGRKTTGVTTALTLMSFYSPALIFISDQDDDALIGARPQHGIVIERPYSCSELSAALDAALARRSEVCALPFWRLGRGTDVKTSLPTLHEVGDLSSKLHCKRRVADSDAAIVVQGKVPEGFFCKGVVAIRQFASARFRGVTKSFLERLDKEIGKSLLSGIGILLLAASAPLLGFITPLPPILAWFASILVVVKMLSSSYRSP